MRFMIWEASGIWKWEVSMSGIKTWVKLRHTTNHSARSALTQPTLTGVVAQALLADGCQHGQPLVHRGVL